MVRAMKPRKRENQLLWG